MRDFLIYLHNGLATTALLYFLVITIWGYVLFFRRRGIGSAYWGMLAIGEILVIAEGLIGGTLWLSGLRPVRGLHILYGFVIPLIIPGAYLYTKGRATRSEALIYGLATIITVGLILRAMYTARFALPGG